MLFSFRVSFSTVGRSVDLLEWFNKTQQSSLMEGGWLVGGGLGHCTAQYILVVVIVSTGGLVVFSHGCEQSVLLLNLIKCLHLHSVCLPFTLIRHGRQRRWLVSSWVASSQCTMSICCWCCNIKRGVQWQRNPSTHQSCQCVSFYWACSLFCMSVGRAMTELS